MILENWISKALCFVFNGTRSILASFWKEMADGKDTTRGKRMTEKAQSAPQSQISFLLFLVLGAIGALTPLAIDMLSLLRKQRKRALWCIKWRTTNRWWNTTASTLSSLQTKVTNWLRFLWASKLNQLLTAVELKYESIRRLKRLMLFLRHSVFKSDISNRRRHTDLHSFAKRRPSFRFRC